MESTRLAQHLGWSLSKVSRVEAGRVNLSDVEVMHFLGPLGIYLGEAHELLAICREAMLDLGYFVRPHPPGLCDVTCALIFHESTADESIGYEPELVPGLLQTESYVRGLNTRRGPMCDVNRAVETRRERQRILQRQKPARFRFYINENALRLEVGNAAIMHDQMLKLALMAELPHIRIRVVPSSVGPTAAVGGSFRLLRYAQHRPLVHLDAHFGGLFLERKVFVDNYRALLLPVIDGLALSAERSREFLVSLANEYDRDRFLAGAEEERP